MRKRPREWRCARRKERNRERKKHRVGEEAHEASHQSLVGQIECKYSRLCRGTGSRTRTVPKESDAGSCRVYGSESGFAHETSDIEGTRENVTEILCFGAVGLAEPRRTFQVMSGLVGIAAFGIAETTDAQLPGGRADLEVTSETDIAIWEGTIDDDGTAAREIWMLVGTMGGDKGKDSLGVRGRIVEEDIR